MIGNRMRAFVLSTAFAIIASALPAAAAPFDGSWNMALVTTSGHCGVIRLAWPSTAATFPRRADVSSCTRFPWPGSGSGATKLNGVAGLRQAKGVGHFTRSKGIGKLNGTGPSGVCSGIWTAVRS